MNPYHMNPYHLIDLPRELAQNGDGHALRLLLSPHYSVRRFAFNTVRQWSRDYLEDVWREHRGLLPAHGGQLDCFGRVEVVLPQRLVFERVLVTVVSPGYEEFVRHLVASLRRVGEDAPLVVFCVNESYETLSDVPGIVRVRCIAREKINAAIKGVLYSCTKWIEANYIAAIETDMVLLEPLADLWTTLAQTARGTVAGCRPQAFMEGHNTLQWVLNDERQEETPLPWLSDEKFFYNGGLIAGDAHAWREIHRLLAGLGPFAFTFLDGGMERTYGEEILVNWAINHLNRVELHPGWNATFFSTNRAQWLTTLYDNGRRYYECHARPAKILHFMGASRYGPDNLMSIMLREIEENAAHAHRMTLIECRDCGKVKSCGSCFEATTFAPERLLSGMRSAVCETCFAIREGRSPESVPLDIRLELQS